MECRGVLRSWATFPWFIKRGSVNRVGERVCQRVRGWVRG